MGRLSGKTAIITGATSGIGRATALLFAEEGAGLVLTGRRRELGQSLEAECRRRGVRALFVEADHTRSEDCARVVEAGLGAFGQIDILFNNAGIVTKGTAETTSEEDWARRWR
jgi:NAD(P)-dependent dehydrogenase (short-subunit alcohol dehydrogenase family)